MASVSSVKVWVKVEDGTGRRANIVSVPLDAVIVEVIKAALSEEQVNIAASYVSVYFGEEEVRRGAKVKDYTETSDDKPLILEIDPGAAQPEGPSPKKPRLDPFQFHNDEFQPAVPHPLHSGEMISTFYIIDINYPTRLQTTMNLEGHPGPFDFSQLCDKLKPQSIKNGKYIMMLAKPKVFFFCFDKTDLRSATKLRDQDLVLKKENRSGLDSILLPQPFVHLVEFDMVMVSRRQFKAYIGPSETAEHVCEPFMIPVKQELAMNDSLVMQIQESTLFSDGFTISCQSKYSLLPPISRLINARVDITIYHTTKFVHKDTVTGAVLRQQREEEEDVAVKDDHVTEGFAGELKMEDLQEKNKILLIGSMERVAAELAHKAVKKGIIFREAIIYGFLIDGRTGSTIVGKLVLDFLNVSSELVWTNKGYEFNDCLCRLHNALDK